MSSDLLDAPSERVRVVDEESALSSITCGGAFAGGDDSDQDAYTDILCSNRISRRRDAPHDDSDSGEELETAARAPHTIILAVKQANMDGSEEKPLQALEEGRAGGRPDVVFDSLRYEVPLPSKEKLVVLDGTTSSFRCGEVTAVMGSSGAGKTSLLDVVAGRAAAGKVEGTVIVGGARPTNIVRKRYSGYCVQRDTLVAVLSVRETLKYTAELKCSAVIPRAAKFARVEEVLKELGLEDCGDTVVGNDLDRGISGGQRKRLNIGVALVTKPPVLLLDEPTSGLDAATADEILAVASSLARSGGGRVVAATLHSPSSRAFRLSVDKLLPGDSLADHVIYALSSRGADDDALAEAWATSPGGESEKDASAAATERSAESASLSAVADCLAYHARDPRRDEAVATSFLHGATTLLRYRGTRSYGDGEYVGVRLGDKIIFGLVIGTLYFNEAQKHRDDGHANNVASLLWITVVLPGYGAAAYVPQIVDERATFVREVADGCYLCRIQIFNSTSIRIDFDLTELENSQVWSGPPKPVVEFGTGCYDVGTYVAYKCVEEFAIMLPFSGVFAGLIYFMVKFQCSFAVFWATYYLNSCVGIALAYAVAAFSPTTEAANALLPTYVTTNIFFTGYLILWDDIPKPWRWYPWVNPMHGWVGLMQDEFDDSDDPYADVSDIRRLLPRPLPPPRYDAARNYEFLDAHFPQLPVRRRELHGAARCLVELLDYVVDARRVDPSRVLLSGESQGGSVAAYAALQSPHALGGVVLYQTFLADQAYMLEWAARNADDLARKAKTPWFVHSGAADDVLPFADWGCASLTMERVHGSVLDFLARFPQVEIAGGGLYAGVGHGGDSAESRAALRAFYDAAFSADRRRSEPAWRGDDARTPALEDAWYPAP
ncbi:ATPase [Aureococcus anophagefferens]|nr:ATPase [Aureococcus anophagefferens]